MWKKFENVMSPSRSMPSRGRVLPPLTRMYSKRNLLEFTDEGTADTVTPKISAAQFTNTPTMASEKKLSDDDEKILEKRVDGKGDVAIDRHGKNRISGDKKEKESSRGNSRVSFNVKPIDIDSIEGMRSKPKLPKMDFLELENDRRIKMMLRQHGDNTSQDEVLQFSAFVTKVNRKGKEQKRVLIITDKAIYNVDKEDTLISKSGRFVFKRRIQRDHIDHITQSTDSDEFVLHVRDEYDYHYKTERRKEILEILSKPERIRIVDTDEDLTKFVTLKSPRGFGNIDTKHTPEKFVESWRLDRVPSAGTRERTSTAQTAATGHALTTKRSSEDFSDVISVVVEDIMKEVRALSRSAMYDGALDLLTRLSDNVVVQATKSPRDLSYSPRSPSSPSFLSHPHDDFRLDQMRSRLAEVPGYRDLAKELEHKMEKFSVEAIKKKECHDVAEDMFQDAVSFIPAKIEDEEDPRLNILWEGLKLITWAHKLNPEKLKYKKEMLRIETILIEKGQIGLISQEEVEVAHRFLQETRGIRKKWQDGKKNFVVADNGEAAKCKKAAMEKAAMLSAKHGPIMKFLLYFFPKCCKAKARTSRTRALIEAGGGKNALRKSVYKSRKNLMKQRKSDYMALRKKRDEQMRNENRDSARKESTASRYSVEIV
mmetsp:Transcript_6140/g.11565  ORF Transcript_6140/g.11565 Transcript_6140/m.11565 type:complete len:654 (-) Transcript_6140:186-2147(-)